MIRTAITVAAASLATAASFVTVSTVGHAHEARQQDINSAVCKAVVKLDGAITDSLHRSLVNLPKLAYYQQHPDELASQKAEVRETLKTFRPPPECHDQGGTS